MQNLVYQPNDPKIIEAWLEYLRWLHKIVDITKEAQMELFIIATPFFFQFFENPELDYPQKILKEFCEENKIRFVDVLVFLRRDFLRSFTKQEIVLSNQESLALLKSVLQNNSEAINQFWETYFRDDDHPTKAGHRYIAEILYPIVYDSLITQQLVASRDR